jgi:hypothetical protein
MASKKDERGLKPLRRFDFGLVLERMDGALINGDRDLQRLVKRAEAMKDAKNARKLMLFVVLMRFAKNSFMSVRYLCADTPDDSKRKLNFALAVPTINRQLLDLLFSVVYMFDDINVRSDEYERAGCMCWMPLTSDHIRLGAVTIRAMGSCFVRMFIPFLIVDISLLRRTTALRSATDSRTSSTTGKSITHCVAKRFWYRMTLPSDRRPSSWVGTTKLCIAPEGLSLIQK